jgi:hypothetical protein
MVASGVEERAGGLDAGQASPEQSRRHQRMPADGGLE